MSLPVSHYEALLAEVRGLRRKAQRVQQLATPLISNLTTTTTTKSSTTSQQQQQDDDLDFQISLLNTMDPISTLSTKFDGVTTRNTEGNDTTTTTSEDEFVTNRNSTHLSVSSEPIPQRDRGLSSVLYHGTWPNEKTMWNSDPTTFKPVLAAQNVHMQDVNSVMSFDSSAGAMALDRFLGSPNLSRRSSQQLEAKFDMVYSLLSMLSGQEHADMGETLLALSTNQESCLAMRQSGCIPLLVQMIQSDKEKDTRLKASQALQNLIHFQTDDKIRKREIRIFKLLEQTRAYIDALNLNIDVDSVNVASTSESIDNDKHPVQTIAHLMKLSFDEGHRQAICQLGGIHVISNLVEIEHSLHGSITEETHCILMRRYACMALTNLTFGDSVNKLLLCSFREFMRALVVQLQSPSDELRQVTASVLRNLSWRAETNSKDILREVGTVTGLMRAAMLDNKENTLKSILSALWNLSAHSTENKSEICSIDGALGFLVDMLTYKTPSKSLAIIENAGGILRNISSQIAVRDDYRAILRQHNCLQILLEQLKSPSLTIVSNACGTLWNLSAKCHIDQEILWDMGAPSMLRSLNHSKHKMIAMGSSAALKNLLQAKPTETILPQMDSTALSMDLPILPTLGARKQKNLMQDLDHTLSETYENIEKHSPIKSTDKYKYKTDDYNSLNCEPSTSKIIHQNSSGSSSLPYVDSPKQQSKIAVPVRRSSPQQQQQQNEPKFIKNKPKSVAKKVSSVPVDSTKEYNRNEYVDYSSSSSSSVDNDRQKRKEIHSDEKDRCSIEDISDTDAVSIDGNYQQQEQHNNSDSATELLPPPITTTTTTINHYNNLNEIDMSDIMVELIDSELPQDEQMEKRDIEKEKQNNLSEVVEEIDEEIAGQFDSDAIHINKDEQYLSNNNSISNQTSTSAQIANNIGKSIRTTNDSGDEMEANEAIQITHNSIPSLNVQQPADDLKCSLPLNCFDDGGSDIKIEKPELLNISQENNNTNQMDENKQHSNSDFSDICRNDSNIKTCSYLTNENCELDHYLERSCDETNQLDNRMLDPAAMIESLDRFTAELVSQSSHLQNKDDKYKISDNTWADDTDLTFPSLSDSPPNIITFDSTITDQSNHHISENNDVIIDYRDDVDGAIINDDKQPQSNDFSSLNTSTLTQSTLIAIEARKIATVFQNEAEMSQSITSVASLELDHVQPPSQLNSLNASPKLIQRKKSLPSNLMVRKLLNNSTNNNGSSIESFENYSLLDQVNPPSSLLDTLDLDGSLHSVASLPSENYQQKTDFQINGIVNNNNSKSINQTFKQPLSLLGTSSIIGLDNVNPPSFLHEITDLCNSLADVPTEAIGSETEIFEDCRTHVTEALIQQQQQQQTEDDVTEFSDANSITPIQSDIGSSPDLTPKKIRNFNNKQMTSKQRRNFARDRYKTYTVAAEMVMKEEQEKLQQDSTSDDYKSVEYFSEDYKSVDNSSSETTTYVSPTYNIEKNSNSNSRTTPKERRQQDRSRFETQIVEEPLINHSQLLIENGSDSSGNTSSTKQSPIRNKLSIRRNFIQKRLENKERFKTQTLTEASFSPSPELTSSSSSPPVGGEMDLHFMVQKEANLVLKTLKETKTNCEELLEYETLSLVSNDDDSEQNSASSTNYKTYHKSWGLRKNIPIIAPAPLVPKVPTPVHNEKPDNHVEDSEQSQQEDSVSDDENGTKIPAKPKIVKPSEKPVVVEPVVDDDGGQGKSVRGRRKALYSKSSIVSKVAPKTIKPIQTMTSNAIKNVVKTVAHKTAIATKSTTPTSRASSGYGTKPNTPKTSPAHSNKNTPKSTINKDVKTVPKGGLNQRLIPTPERQGTFTKDEPTSASSSPSTTKCRIPTKLPMSKLPIKPSISKIPSRTTTTTANKLPTRNLPTKSASSDRANTRNLKTLFVRSTSADSRDKPSGHLQASSSSHNLKNTVANKKTGIPQVHQQRSVSNTNLNNTPNTITTSKQVTSRIASLWKKVEESKKQQPVKKDTRVWIQANDKQQNGTTCIDNNNKDGVVVMRNKTDQDPVKRISRLGSFIVMDDERDDPNQTPICNDDSF